MDKTTWVYMLRCNDGKYYVGSYRGEDITTRVVEHNAGIYDKAWTKKRRPVTLVWSDLFPNADQAVDFERQIKGWNRKKKEALIEGRHHELPALSRRGPT
ncbi:MAG: GIY-YIG nuclease family protein [Pseudomonadota bacterium]